MKELIERLFELEARGSSYGTELLAGITTFLTMSYVLFVNPSILASAGMDFHSVYIATCIAAAFGCLVMGLYANYPIALAPGMGINAYFAITVVIGMGVAWEVALGAVFCSGLLFLLISISPIREWIINSIPRSQKRAIAAGIGLFLIFLGFQNAGILVDHPATLVGIGNLASWPVFLAILGFAAIAATHHLRFHGAIALTILALAGIGWIAGISNPPDAVFGAVVPQDTTLLKLDVFGALELGLLVVVFSLLLVDLFDTSGTLIALTDEAGLLNADRRLPNLHRALVADSSATIVGSLVGTSTTTSYIESAAGIRAGGRTGLTAVVVGGFVLLMLPFEPIARAIPEFALAPAILFVGCVMAQSISGIEWEDVTESIPAVVTAISIPFTFSIATGIGFGFISFVLIKVLAGKVREVHPAMGCIAILFAVKFLFNL